MSQLKLYVFDQGWAGAELFVTSDKQKAIEKLIDPQIQHYRALDQLHKRDHPDRHNPWIAQINYLETNRQTVLQEYDITEGLSVTTTGE
jgi:hypothetical protein